VTLGLDATAKSLMGTAAGKSRWSGVKGGLLVVIASSSDFVIKIILRPVAVRLRPVDLVVIDSSPGRSVR
jgi:hypothetical protein